MKQNINRRDFLKLSTNSLLALSGLLGIGGADQDEIGALVVSVFHELLRLIDLLLVLGIETCTPHTSVCLATRVPRARRAGRGTSP